MKLSSVYSSLLAATLSTLGVATILIDPISSTVLVNDTLDITWSADQDYVSDHLLEAQRRFLLY